MGRLDGIEYFTTAVASGSFAAAARRLGVTPSAVSRRVAILEGELGVQLLARTTRSLRLTHDGLAFHERCMRILEELHEAHDAIARVRRKPAGLLRVDAPLALGRSALAPRLSAFLDAYPEIHLDLTLRDQVVDPIAEALDVVVRIGALRDSTLIARRLGESHLLFCASPDYVRRYGAPTQPRDLARHQCLGYLREGRADPFTFTSEGGTTTVDIAGPCNANDVDVLLHMALAGKGVALLFDFVVADQLAKGTLVRVLEGAPPPAWPIHALYPKNRHLLPKVGVFLEFLASLWSGGRPGRTPRQRTR